MRIKKHNSGMVKDRIVFREEGRMRLDAGRQQTNKVRVHVKSKARRGHGGVQLLKEGRIQETLFQVVSTKGILSKQ